MKKPRNYALEELRAEYKAIKASLIEKGLRHTHEFKVVQKILNKIA